MKKVKSPLNYIGGKSKILDQILPLFPENIETFIDLFSGGCNVGINTKSKKVIFNDNLTQLIDMFNAFKANKIEKIISHINERMETYNLSLINEEGYKKIRDLYNKDKQPLDLFVLIAYSFNHQIRFNSNHDFNNPFGRERSSFNSSMKRNLEEFVLKLQQTNAVFTNKCFTDFDFSDLSENDFVYCDPPYLITTGSYNDGKRGFKGWSENEEKQLLEKLDTLNKKGVKFALSNVLEHKGKSNKILKNWIESNNSYVVNYIDFNYSNSNYQTLDRDKRSTVEVLITNYLPKKPAGLFDEINSNKI